MPLETKPFDSARHFMSPDAQAELIRDAFEEGDERYIDHALATVVRARQLAKEGRDGGAVR